MISHLVFMASVMVLGKLIVLLPMYIWYCYHVWAKFVISIQFWRVTSEFLGLNHG